MGPMPPADDGPEVVNGITFTPLPPSSDFPGVRLWGATCIECGDKETVAPGMVEAARDGALARFRTPPPWSGWICTNCDRRRLATFGLRTGEQPEIGTRGWYATAPRWDRHGVVDSILRLLVQEVITRTKAVELLRYATEVWSRSVLQGMVPAPTAPWDHLNWAP
jgi:hypothetical protein